MPPKIVEGHLTGGGHRFALVVSRFNGFITERLLEGALDALARHGVEGGQVEVVRVPGAWELPVTARRLAEGGRFAAIVCLGAVIRGETPHFEYVAGEAARGVGAVARETGVPVVFGLLTTDTLEQAIERAGTKGGNRGFDAALVALEMANLFDQLK